ncbi:apolipoprotein D-like [Agrilus planipennis]|uniref:Apolipoprotein D-like n=1 Tax=Agrilus planipennis TaxID=224129 RepID=A0A1W4WNZ9_AGRPL|nr:apolipoprotein D-like [Agrilus planipennis]
MRLYYASFCTLMFISLTVAQVPSLGWCPEYVPMNDFDIERFLGKWYEQERYFTFSEVASRCVVTDYARAPSGKIFVSNEITSRLTGIKRVIAGEVGVVGKDGEGQITIKYATTPISTETKLKVLETDYDNFAVVWSCSGIGPVHTESAWVMTRERLPSGQVLQKAYGILDKYRINRTFFIKTDQEGCALAASDLNAVNGLTPTATVLQTTGAEQKSTESKEKVP